MPQFLAMEMVQAQDERFVGGAATVLIRQVDGWYSVALGMVALGIVLLMCII